MGTEYAKVEVALHGIEGRLDPDTFRRRVEQAVRAEFGPLLRYESDLEVDLVETAP